MGEMRHYKNSKNNMMEEMFGGRLAFSLPKQVERKPTKKKEIKSSKFRKQKGNE